MRIKENKKMRKAEREERVRSIDIYEERERERGRERGREIERERERKKGGGGSRERLRGERIGTRRTGQPNESRKYESFVQGCNTFATYYFILIVHCDNDFYLHLRECEKDTDSIYTRRLRGWREN